MAVTSDSAWPALPLEEWQDTRDTLMLWTQVIGKIRIARTPLINHWWNAPLYLTARGLTTSLIPYGPGRSFAIDLDFGSHTLEVVATDGACRSLPLASMGTVAEFHARLMQALDELGLHTEIWPLPVEITDDAVPFDKDDVHGRYDAEHARRFWLLLVQAQRVFQEFSARYVGKASPIHLFWGALDLATTRFSGREAPPHPGGAPNCGPHVMLEAYSHEVSSCGYWPGGGGEGLFYSYAYPEPPGYRDRPVSPPQARYDQDLGEFVLPYEAMRTAARPGAVLLDFLQTTYEAAAECAHWDREKLERHS